MADAIDTGGGASVGGDVGTGGGDVIGRDEIKQVVNVELDSLTDLRTDIAFVKRDILELKFAEYDIRARIEDLRREIVRSQQPMPQVTNAQPLTPAWLIVLLIAIFMFTFVVIFGLFYLVRKSF